MFDYVRFPSDGMSIERPTGTAARSASARRSRPSCATRIAGSTRTAFASPPPCSGCLAARDLGIGQIPRRMAPHLDTVYAMTYPSLFGPGELGLQDPSTAPGATVSRALRRFELALRGRNALVVPWVQDFSFTVPYGIDEVQARRSTPRGSPAPRGYTALESRGPVHDRRARAALDVRARVARARQPSDSRTVADAVVKPVVAMRPELDARRDESVAAPERWERDVDSCESLLGLGDADVELVTPAERLRLR